MPGSDGLPAEHAPAPPDSGPGPQAAAPMPSAPGTAVLALGGRLDRADIPALCERLGALLRDTGTGSAAGATTGTGGLDVVSDAGAVTEPDLVTVEAVARLQLTARRLGHRMRLRDAHPSLRGLLELAGLCEVVSLHGGPVGAEACGQAEQREEMGGVEEGVEPGDPPG